MQVSEPETGIQGGCDGCLPTFYFTASEIRILPCFLLLFCHPLCLCLCHTDGRSRAILTSIFREYTQQFSVVEHICPSMF